MTMDMWLQARNQGFDRETPAQLIENLANWDDMIDAMLSDSTYIQGGPNSEMRRLLRLRRVRRLLEIGAEDPALVTPLLRTTLMDVLEQWLPIVQEKMHPTKPARNQSEPDEWDKLTIRAIAATYLLGELKDYDALPLLNHAFLMQQGWVKTIERWGADQAPVPPAMSLYAMHRLIVQIPPDRILPQAAAARADYMIYAAQNIPDAIVFKKSAANSDGGITYRELPPGAPVEERPFTFHPPPPGPYRTDLVRYPVMLFRDGGEIQTESSLSQVLSDRAWDWHARMAAFIELNFP
jgi:hypothetical protein